MDKNQAYRSLVLISEKYGVDITEYVEDIALNETITDKSLRFIMSYENAPTEFLESLKDKKFYKTLREETSPVEVSKALSSLFTHALIEVAKNPESRSVIMSSINASELLESLKEYALNGDSVKMTESASYIMSIYNKMR